MSTLEWMRERYGEPTTDDDDEVDQEQVEKPDYAPQIRERLRTQGIQPDAVRPQSPIFSLRHFYSGECGGWVIPQGSYASEDKTWDAGLDSFSEDYRLCVRLKQSVSCECGTFTNRMIQLDGSMAEVIMGILGIDVPYGISF